MKTILLGLLAVIATSSTFAQKPKHVSTLLNSGTSQIQLYYPGNANVNNKAIQSTKYVIPSVSKKELMKREITNLNYNPILVQPLDSHLNMCAECIPQVTVNRKGSKQGGKEYTCTMFPGSGSNQVTCPICKMNLQTASGK